MTSVATDQMPSPVVAIRVGRAKGMPLLVAVIFPELLVGFLDHVAFPW